MDSLEDRPVPRWLHVWSIVTVTATALLLILGGFVTTFRVGMADPVWPTEPWYLASNYKLDFGYRLEHFHRILGWLVGVLGLVLTFGVWAVEPRRRVRWFGIGTILIMTLAFAAIHGVLRQTAPGQEGVAVYANVVAMFVSSLFVLAVALRAYVGGGSGGLVRAVVALGMLAAMVQGLLGGLRVRLNELVGADLAVVHGTFAVIVFALLMATAVLTARPSPGPTISPAVARSLRWLTGHLVVLTFVQIAFGAWIRHAPSPAVNRLHLLFAFVVVGFAILAIAKARSDAAARERLRWPIRFLIGLIVLQIVLGVEAWLGKFLTGAPPEFEVLTRRDWDKALTRTAHAHVGAWVLAVGVAFALIVRRNSAEPVGPTARASLNWTSSTLHSAATGVRSPA